MPLSNPKTTFGAGGYGYGAYSGSGSAATKTYVSPACLTSVVLETFCALDIWSSSSLETSNGARIPRACRLRMLIYF